MAKPVRNTSDLTTAMSSCLSGGRAPVSSTPASKVARSEKPEARKPSMAPKPLPRPAAQSRILAAGGTGDWWVYRIPKRLWFLCVIATAPLRALVMLLDALVALCVLSIVALGWAWWTHRITDDQVAGVLATLGGRLLGILSKSGVF